MSNIYMHMYDSWNNGQMASVSLIEQNLSHPGSPTGKAFMDGCRAMIDTFRALNPQEVQEALLTNNNQHIIALLVRNEQKKSNARYADIRSILDYYRPRSINDAISFVFDVNSIDLETGVALDENGKPIEDRDFTLLPEKTWVGCPDYKIESRIDGSEIDRGAYLKLDTKTRRDYSYARFITLKSTGGSTLKVSFDDHHFVGEIIKSLIMLGLTGVNDRLLSMSGDCGLGHEEAGDALKHSLSRYRHIINCDATMMHSSARNEPFVQMLLDACEKNQSSRQDS